MSRSVEFHVDRLIADLNIAAASQLNYYGPRAMKVLGYELKQDLSRHMQRVFRNPVPYTLSSPYYRANGLEVAIGISPKVGFKGNAPSAYLYPVSTEDTAGTKPAYDTRFITGLRKMGVANATTYAYPWLQGRGVPTNNYGNVKPSFYSSVLAGLRRYGQGDGTSKRSAYTYFAIPDLRHPSARASKRRPGIYRRRGSTLEYLFSLSTRPRQVRTTFDFAGYTTARAEAILRTTLSTMLSPSQLLPMQQR